MCTVRGFLEQCHWADWLQININEQPGNSESILGASWYVYQMRDNMWTIDWQKITNIRDTICILKFVFFVSFSIFHERQPPDKTIRTLTSWKCIRPLPLFLLLPFTLSSFSSHCLSLFSHESYPLPVLVRGVSYYEDGASLQVMIILLQSPVWFLAGF